MARESLPSLGGVTVEAEPVARAASQERLAVRPALRPPARQGSAEVPIMENTMTSKVLAAAAGLLALLAAAHPGLAAERQSAAPAGAGSAGASSPSATAGKASASVDRQTIRRLCEADLRTHCAGIRPGGGRLMQCARAHEAQLSADCRAALETLDAYRNARPN